MEQITSLTNTKVKLAISLQQKKYRDKHQLFLLEGIRNAEMAITKDINVNMCFVTDKALENERSQQILAKLNCPIYHVSEHIYQKISDTTSPQGLMLIIPQQNLTLDDFLANSTNKDSFYLVLDRLQDPGNLGTIIRTADAMGANGIICLAGTADIYAPKVVRSAMGSLFNIPIVTKIYENDFLTTTDKYQLKLFATALDSTAKASWNINYPKNCAIILGNEANGVSDSLLNIIDTKIYIPMRGNAESLNVANAASMIMYEYCRQNI